MGQSSQQPGSLFWSQSGYKIASLAEHVQKIQDSEDDVKVTGLKQSGLDKTEDLL
jgi:hypothetical protein